MNTVLDNDERFEELESICAILTIKNCDFYMRKAPLEEEDPTGEMFSTFSKLIQSIAMWPTTQGIEKCTISQVIMEYNQNFNIPIANIMGYLNDACANQGDIHAKKISQPN